MFLLHFAHHWHVSQSVCLGALLFSLALGIRVDGQTTCSPWLPQCLRRGYWEGAEGTPPHEPPGPRSP